MTAEERYLFDLRGYLVVSMLDADFCRAFLEMADQIGKQAADLLASDAPETLGHDAIHFKCHPSGFSAYKSGEQIVVDDILPFFPIANHSQTMAYVNEMIKGPVRIGSSELRIRYEGSVTHTHMGGPIDARNRYCFPFDLLAVRVLYALHDIWLEDGPLCVVPGSHKANLNSPYNPKNPQDEPWMIPIEMKAGEAVIFTENLRHGGLPVRMRAPRKTLHLMYSPEWVGSQSPVHWNQ